MKDSKTLSLATSRASNAMQPAKLTQAGPSSAAAAHQHLPTEQKRAQHAWGKAEQGVKEHNSSYVNLAKGVPALIMNSGLMQVMAFLEGKDEHHRALAADLRDWLHLHCRTPRDFDGFMQHLFQTPDPRRYQDLSAEALAWLRWLRQFAAALNKTPPAQG